RGITLTPEQCAAAARSDPLGIEFLMPFAPNTEHWPSPAWLPVNVALAPEPAVDWAWFGLPPPLLDRAALRRAMERPFNRVWRKRMRLRDFVAGAEDSAAPAGFLFHMSRCGSTLAARMSACIADVLTLSEWPAMSETVALAHRLGPEQGTVLLRAMLAAFCRRGAAHRLIVRFDAHNTLALPMVAHASAQTPVAFLYRDPVEVLVSYARDSGIEAAFAGNFAAMWNAGDLRGLGKDDLTARGLARICESAASHIGTKGGLAVNYREIPDAVTDVILPRFGITADDAAREAMQRVARMNAKVANAAFEGDGARKQRDADDALRARADAELGTVYRALEALAARAP
ncbi:MAG TPA: hypothetical protein VFV07_13315, partial [Rhizomicrobium sp.]|nr:hypothetical protein [Rhizomicrobium sp.]